MTVLIFNSLEAATAVREILREDKVDAWVEVAGCERRHDTLFALEVRKAGLSEADIRVKVSERLRALEMALTNIDNQPK